ncbi:MAG: CidA/LrgA family protein [Solobacterium sp.]|nr:CidA/LrgA family protein [Solobacterium sp.]MBQ9823379.1 CidA/LrgA family protein [Solobacterium sp.]
MKLLKQFLLIMLVTCTGEIIRYVVPLPIPASIYGLVLMFILLYTGVIKLDQVKTAAQFLIEIMPVMFIPAAVALMDSWSALQPILIPALVTIIVCNIVVMVVTGKTAEFIIKKDRKGEKA